MLFKRQQVIKSNKSNSVIISNISNYFIVYCYKHRISIDQEPTKFLAS